MCFFHFANLCLLLAVLRVFTFNIIVATLGFKSDILLFSFLFLVPDSFLFFNLFLYYLIFQFHLDLFLLILGVSHCSVLSCSGCYSAHI